MTIEEQIMIDKIPTFIKKRWYQIMYYNIWNKHFLWPMDIST